MKRIFWGGVAACALVGSAGAADLGARRVAVPAAILAPAFDWTGFYLGAHIGYGFGSTRHVALNIDAFDGALLGETIRSSPRGVLGGIHFGYNWQSGNLLAGLEAELGYSGVTGSRIGSNVQGDVYGSTRYGFTAFVGPRLGFVADRALFYVKGGLAVATIRNIAADLDGGNTVMDPTATSQVTRTRAGWAIGGGVEYAFAPNWSARLEYLYSNFGSFTSSDLNGGLYRHTNDVHAVKLGVSYLFRTGPGAVVARY
ncbi:MAG: porin family protein [Rhizobiales bacterium]|nr:porin family protein [Hyphomicrobiales bacterium]